MKFPPFRFTSPAASLIIILNDDCAENRTILFPLSNLVYTMNEQMNERTNLDLTSRPGSFPSIASQLYSPRNVNTASEIQEQCLEWNYRN